MTIAQLVLLLALCPAGADFWKRIKFISMTSGKSYNICVSYGVPARYTVVLDQASGLMAFTEITRNASGPDNGANAVIYGQIASIDTIGLFDAGEDGVQPSN